MLPIFALLPIIAGAFILLVPSFKWSKHIALASSLLSLFLIILIVLAPPSSYNLQWFSIYGIDISLILATYALNKILLILVGIITPLIFFYSFGYMDVPSEQKRFYFEISIFAASMMLFAISNNFISLFIAWEFLGITSYLLIGFWRYNQKALLASRKAITTIIIGDLLLLIAIAWIYIATSSFNFSAISYSKAISIPLVLIALAIFTKSAQLPFEEWLPDAMEGPTPVSAFLHSSTMVKAGVFLAMLLFPLYSAANLLWLFLVFGIITSIIAVTNAISEYHIKRILAYSTMEDLGLMFIALGLGNLYVALVLFIVQTFYKALLFMASGSIMKANDGETNIYRLFNSKSNSILYYSMLIGVISFAGIFPLGGFFGKVSIEALASNAIEYAILLAIDFGSSIYIFRWLIPPSRNFTGSKNPSINYKFLPISMEISELAVAALVAVSGLSFIFIQQLSHISISVVSSLIETLCVAAGFIVAYLMFKASKFSFHPSKRLFNLAYNSIFVNIAYSYVVKAFEIISEYMSYFDEFVDRVFIYPGKTTIIFARKLAKIVTGNVDTYAFAILIGIILIILIISF
ncbi:MAG: proton-conducting transporter membrane subunit [Candidatus Micrarchaeaceae archaeon]